MPEVHLIATVLTGQLFGVGDAFLRFRVFAGESHWTLLDGDATGQTHTAKADPVSDVVTWSHPVELHYVCSSLVGWPRIAVAVWQVDSFGRNEIAGYGVAFVPPSPGIHVVDLACWRPEGSTLQELGAWFRGGVPQLTDTSVLLGSAMRHHLATVTTGTVQLEVQVLCKGFDAVGVALSS